MERCQEKARWRNVDDEEEGHQDGPLGHTCRFGWKEMTGWSIVGGVNLFMCYLQSPGEVLLLR